MPADLWSCAGYYRIVSCIPDLTPKQVKLEYAYYLLSIANTLGGEGGGGDNHYYHIASYSSQHTNSNMLCAIANT